MPITRILLTTVALAALCTQSYAATTVTKADALDANGKTVSTFSLSVVDKPARVVLNDLLAAAGEKTVLSDHVHGTVTAKVDGKSFSQTLLTIMRGTHDKELWTDDDVQKLNRAQGREMTKNDDRTGFIEPNPINTWAIGVDHGTAQAMMAKLKSGKAGAPFDEPIVASSDDRAIVYRGDRQKHVILRTMVAILDK